MRRRALAVMILALGGAGACSLFYGFDGFEGAVVATDAGVDAADASERDANVCGAPTWPAAPTSSDGPDRGPVILAVDQLAVLPTPGVTRGLNLDGLCTCPGPAACRSAKQNCDADGGVDNASATLFSQLSLAGGGLDDKGLRTGNEKGDYALLARIVGWNGTLNDPSVAVSILNGYALDTPAPPKHDGSDVWRIDEEGFPAGNLAVYTSSRAWITAGTIVAEVAQAVLKIRVPSAEGTQLLRLELSELRFVARLVPGTTDFTLEDGLIAGRWLAKNALDQVQINRVCQSDPLYPTIKANVCSSLDLASRSSDDGRDVPCGSVSFAFGFTAKGAKLGDIGTPVETPPKCAPIVADSCD